eukprot:5057056-Amphidinium_carterae.1
MDTMAKTRTKLRTIHGVKLAVRATRFQGRLKPSTSKYGGGTRVYGTIDVHNNHLVRLAHLGGRRTPGRTLQDAGRLRAKLGREAAEAAGPRPEWGGIPPSGPIHCGPPPPQTGKGTRGGRGSLPPSHQDLDAP